MKRALALSFMLAACKPEGPVEQYGFVATLGNDTVSVERVSKDGPMLPPEVEDGDELFVKLPAKSSVG